MTEYKLVVVGGKSSERDPLSVRKEKQHALFSIVFPWTAGGVGKSALTIQLIQNQ